MRVNKIIPNTREGKCNNARPDPIFFYFPIYLFNKENGNLIRKVFLKYNNIVFDNFDISINNNIYAISSYYGIIAKFNN